MRSSNVKRGGGFLNNVDATISAFDFEVGDTVAIKKGERKGEDFTPLYLVPSFVQDSGGDAVSQRLLVGDAAQFGPVSDDGKTLDLGGSKISAYCDAWKFIESLITPLDGGDGFPDERFDEDETTWNLVPAEGTRVHLVQEVNPEKTKRQGKQKGKDGKEYDRKDLKVKSVLSVPEVVAKKIGVKPIAKGKPGKAAKAEVVTVAEVAESTLRDILAAQKDNTIPKARLKMKVFAAFTAAHPNKGMRDEVIKYLQDDDNLGFDGIEVSDDAITAV